jgi:hypothetical protein
VGCMTAPRPAAATVRSPTPLARAICAGGPSSVLLRAPRLGRAEPLATGIARPKWEVRKQLKLQAARAGPMFAAG